MNATQERRQRWRQGVEERQRSPRSLWRFAAPQQFYPLAGRLAPWFAAAAAVLAVAGLYLGFFVAPTDAQQGEVYRVIFLHVPAAWMSMFLYLVMAFWGIVGWVLNTRLSFMMAHALAPTGAIWCFIALWTGALWGRPTWGTYWVWDARLTSELILLFLYLGVIALYNAFSDKVVAGRAAGILALVGVINLPIIHYSVEWWNTLHQGATITKFDKPSISPEMLWPLLIMILAFAAFLGALTLMRFRNELLMREWHRPWVKEIAEQEK